MRAFVSLLMPFSAAGTSPLPVTVVVTVVVLVTDFFNRPFGDGAVFDTVDVVVFLMGVSLFVAVIVRAVVDPDNGRFVVVVVVVDERPPAVVVRVVVVLDKTFVAGTYSQKIRIDRQWCVRG